MTRRNAILLAAVASAEAVTPQKAGNRLVVKSTTGLEITPHGDPNRPALAVASEHHKSTVAVIEFPEHAWTRRLGGAEPEWYYRMYGGDSRYQGKVTWSQIGNALRYVMTVPSGFELTGIATLEDDGVQIDYRIANPSSTAFVETQAPTCIKLYRPFTDVFLERTYVHHADGLDLIASETPERLAKNAEEWLPCRYIVRCSPEVAAPKDRVERLEGITRYHKMRAADAPFIATESTPAGWVAATHTLKCLSLFTNPARTCHHTDPGVPIPANGSADLSLRFYLFRGTSGDAWELVARRRRLNRV